MRCDNCGPMSARAKIRDGLCGRCYSSLCRKPSPAGRARAAQLQRARRARRGSRRTLWVAFRNGDAVGVFSEERLALTVASIVRPFTMNRISKRFILDRRPK